MLDDKVLFNDEETTIDGVRVVHRTRLQKNVDKKTGNFFSWSIEYSAKVFCGDIEIKRDDLAKLCNIRMMSESGINDFTPNGSFFGISQSQMDRALTKRISIPKL